MSTYDDGTELEFFEEPETLEAPGRPRRRIRPPRGGGPRRPAPPPPGAVALARLAGLVALAIAVVIGLVFWVGSCQGQSRHDEYASYMNDVRPIAQSSAASLRDYQRQVTNPKLTLADLQSKLGLWSRQQQEDYDQALRLVPPAPLQAAHQEVLATLQLRAIGLAEPGEHTRPGGNETRRPGREPAGEAGSAPERERPRLGRALQAAGDGHAEEAGRERRDRTGLADRHEPRTDHASLVRRGLRRPALHDHRHGGGGNGPSGIHGSELVSTAAVSSGQSKTLTVSSPTTVDVSADLAFKVTFKNVGGLPGA